MAKRTSILTFSLIFIIALLTVTPSLFALVDVTSKVQAILGRPINDRRTLSQTIPLSIKNISTTVLNAPIRVIITGITDTHVKVANPDGRTADGKPYFDFQQSLSPGQESTIKNIIFSFGAQYRFAFTTAVYTQDDQDNDGFTILGGDCNDQQAAIHPGASDIPNNNIDENCDGVDATVVPKVVGLTQSAGTSAIVAAHLVVGTVSKSFSTTVALGNTISQNPVAGTVVPQGTAVSFMVSLGPDQSSLPPDPTTVAPLVDQTVATTVADSTQFLYTGNNPIQTGVAPGTITKIRAAIIRGKVLQDNGQPLTGVTVNILDHPEFGKTVSRADGGFDLAVNGGGLLTVTYTKKDFLAVRRQINVRWNDFAVVDDVIMIPVDAQVTSVALTSSSPTQVARGSVITDSRGTRQATLIFPAGTQITSGISLSSAKVRATEYTVGSNGSKKMPAVLPPTSAYTYAVEYSLDEAVAAGVKNVQFNKPVMAYVDNFIGFPVGENVPSGYYDPDKSAWVPSTNGRVIKILSIVNGQAVVDVTGSGAAASSSTLTALGFTTTELQKLATLYPAGKTLWRVPVNHFSVWDFNWGYAPKPDAIFPPVDDDSKKDNPLNNGCHQGTDTRPGSTIECQNQILGEDIPVSGTPFDLHYESDHAVIPRIIDFQVTPNVTPSSILKIEVVVTLAGRTFAQEFTNAPNQRMRVVWDGKDAYGRLVQATFVAHVKVSYLYQEFYSSSIQFAAPGSGSNIGGASGGHAGIAIGTPIPFITEWDIPINLMHDLPAGTGGWRFDVHHTYDPVGRVLYMGDGQRRSAKDISFWTTIAGASSSFNEFKSLGQVAPAKDVRIYDSIDGMAFAPDGTLYFATSNGIYQVSPSGIMSAVFDGNFGGGFGEPPTSGIITRSGTSSLAVGPDGSIYFVTADYRIRRRHPNGIITIVAGNGDTGYVNFFRNGGQKDPGPYPNDNGPATLAPIWPTALAVAPDQTVYFTDTVGPGIRKVGPDGVIHTIIGDATNFSDPQHGDGGPASKAFFTSSRTFALGKDGSLYLPDPFIGQGGIRRITPDGIINTFATNFNPSLGRPDINQIITTPNGDLFVSQFGAFSGYDLIYHIDERGAVTQIAGTVDRTGKADELPPLGSGPGHVQSLSYGPDGLLYVAACDDGNPFLCNIRKINNTPFSGLTSNDIFVSSENASEIYHFDSTGKHLETLNALTKAVIYKFAYTKTGQLSSITDGDGNFTQIQRDSAGNMTGILSPFGQQTSVTLNASGYLASVRNPAGETFSLGYKAGTIGLLETFKDPKNNVHTMKYDDAGRLIEDRDPGDAFTKLSRQKIPNGYQVKLSKGFGNTNSFQESFDVNFPDSGGTIQKNTLPDLNIVNKTFSPNWFVEVRDPDGTVTKTIQGPDPRFGMQAPLDSGHTITLPSGLVVSSTHSRSVTTGTGILDLISLSETLTVNGVPYNSAFTAATRTIDNTTPMGRQTSQVIDAQGRIVKNTIAGLNPSVLTYDTRGRLSSVTQGSGTEARTAKFSYDVNGNLSSIIDPANRTTLFTYDAANRVVKQTLPDNRVIGLTYDANGNVTSVMPPGKPAHTFNYTSVDTTSQYTPPIVGALAPTTYAYNHPDHLPTLITRPDGQTIALSYTQRNLKSVTIPTGTYMYGYIPFGQSTTGGTPRPHLMNITAPDQGTISYTYDGFLLTGVTWAGTVKGSVGFSYNNDLRVQSQTLNGVDPIVFNYDADGLLTQAGGLALSRDVQNGLLNATTLGVVTDAMTYNGFAEPASYTAKINGANALTVAYTRDSLGRIIKKNETIGGINSVYDYAYDLAGRLSSVKKNGTTTGSYTYDANGNRVSQTTPQGTLNGTYDAQDRLTKLGTNTYAYSVNGELTSKVVGGVTLAYQYDVLGNLLHATAPVGAIDYVIDGQNRRIGKKVNGTLVQGFLYSNQLNIVAELNGSNAIVSRFVYGSRVNVPDYMVKGGKTYRIISDHLGSPRLVVDTATGTIAQRMDYDEWGNVTNDTSPGFQPFGFVGGLYDRDTKLVRFGARDYDASIGRWTVTDPIGFGGGDANLFGYVNNDPINFIDISGYMPDWLKSLKSWYDNLKDWLDKLESLALKSRVQPSNDVGKINALMNLEDTSKDNTQVAVKCHYNANKGQNNAWVEGKEAAWHWYKKYVLKLKGLTIQP